MPTQFPSVTLLVTHYNRSQSLERLLQAFQKQEIVFGDIVVSDDGSKSEQVVRLKELAANYNFRLVSAPQNKGLGNNINKGQDAVKTAYTLYVQEDFDPFAGYAVHLSNALTIMEERPDVDIARFYAYFKYPYLKPYKFGFSEMVFKIWYPGYKKFHVYSDHPHLRRSTYFEKFGRYAEGLKGDRTEFMMNLSFIKKKGKAVFYEDYKKLFDQVNSSDEPSTMTRSDLRQSNNPLVVLARALYRNVKHTWEVLF
ncbi:glycosyltransferase [Mucilaginibacter sp. PAMB04274]|uniref:glycosyltransferase family 2 protein n=1 Tax=Mucilaginibacter sp. PAMB04274 TaxID=3138568 RepID=UPI0031F635C6